jgi:hypothetical protein
MISMNYFLTLKLKHKFSLVKECRINKLTLKQKLEIFINSKFEEASGENLEDGVTIRKENACRRDLLKWGAKYEKNKKRPYSFGHERPDVEYRHEFVKNFDITKKDFGFLQKLKDGRTCLKP